MTYSTLKFSPKTASPDFMKASSATYKGAMLHLDQFSSISNHKINKLIKLPKNMPFNKLDMRSQRKLVKAICKFEVVNGKEQAKTPKRIQKSRSSNYVLIKTPPSAMNKSVKKNIPEPKTALMQHQITPVLQSKKFQDSADGVKAMLKQSRKHDVLSSHRRSVGNTQPFSTSPTLRKSKLSQKFEKYLMNEAMQNVYKHRHYRGLVGANTVHPGKPLASVSFPRYVKLTIM